RPAAPRPPRSVVLRPCRAVPRPPDRPDRRCGVDRGPAYPQPFKPPSAVAFARADPGATRPQINFAPKLRTGSASAVSRPSAAAGAPPALGTQVPERGLAASLPSRTITSPRRRTVVGQPVTVRPA